MKLLRPACFGSIAALFVPVYQATTAHCAWARQEYRGFSDSRPKVFQQTELDELFWGLHQLAPAFPVNAQNVQFISEPSDFYDALKVMYTTNNLNLHSQTPIERYFGCQASYRYHILVSWHWKARARAGTITHFVIHTKALTNSRSKHCALHAAIIPICVFMCCSISCGQQEERPNLLSPCCRRS